MKQTLNRRMKGLQRSLGLLLLVLTFSSHGLFAQKVTVTGTVKDEAGEIPGVNVIIKGTSKGTVTDVMGNYSISVDNAANAVLEYRFIGYQTKEVKVGNQKVINVTLASDSELIDDVVVVGYGEQKKKSVVGAITQAKGEELLQAGSVTTISEALTGLLPGVSTMQASGQPGATAASILIRGRGTWSSSTPLFLVDGVERDMNNIDPNEVESISVLKDASATAVYGVKGANGVVLVTTKSGKKGKAKINFSANIGIKDPTLDTDYATDYATNLEYYNQALMNDKLYGRLVPQFYIDRFRDPAYADNPYYQYTSFVNELFGRGETQQYNMNISGGNDFVSYFTSLGYQYDGDLFDLQEQPEFDPRTYQKRFNWRTNLDFNLTKSTKFKVKLAGDMTNWNGNPMSASSSTGIAGSGGSLMQRIYAAALINAPAVYEDGRLGFDNRNTVNVNYLGRLEREGSVQKKSSRLWTDFILEQQIAKGLKASAKFAYNQYNNYKQGISKEWDKAPIYYYVQSSDGYNPDYDEDGNVILLPQSDKLDKFEQPASIGTEGINGYNKNIYYEFRLNYNKTFAGKHDLGLMGLFQRRETQGGVGFVKPNEDWVGRVTYGYKDKYLFEGSGAYNGNTYFSPEKRFGFFPSAAVGWVLSEEDWFKEKVNFVNFAKVKYSYGEVGSNGNVGEYMYLSFYNKNTLPMDFGNVPNILVNDRSGLSMYSEGRPSTPGVSWETAIKQNLGIELNMLDNRLQTNFDFFKEDRKDILMTRRTIPVWYGNSFPYDNMGEVKNHGFEVELNWNDNIGDDFSYWFKGNLSLSENRVVERDDAKAAPEYRKNAGKPIGWSAGYYETGQSQNWDDVYSYTGSPLIAGLQPGDLAFNDYNADGIIDVNDQVPIGNASYATKTYTFSAGFTYKNFSVLAMFNGMFGLSKAISNNYLYAYETSSSLGFMLKNNEQKNAWSPLNMNTGVPLIHSTSSDYYKGRSTYSYRDASFLRLRNVEVKYRLPKHVLKRTGFFDSVEFYVNGNNLYTWQTLPAAFDPEAAKLEVYPITKRYNFGFRLSL